ncbi:hypothetical protein J2T09_002028 [Neorhizobium huautlense]|uniref:Uncharacterized protein n=1 Tax=Neorhizobium huautlense TaxID=67774 RepID=A0ABT9PSU5_9HYPH|nr:hypothetical protein [Neorhizobium huautlense]MDP9837276.1 hypothetical protein [Neorhizobium huautlense]
MHTQFDHAESAYAGCAALKPLKVQRIVIPGEPTNQQSLENRNRADGTDEAITAANLAMAS